MKRPLATWIAIAVGLMTTIGAGAIGLARLRQRSHETDDSHAVRHFIEKDRLLAPLMDSEIFSSPRVGYAGDPPQVAPEFLGLLEDARAEEKLMELVARGAPGARLYGLCGLRIVGSNRLGDDPSFVARQDDRRVALARGCGLSVTTPRQVVQSGDFENVCELWRGAHRKAALPNPSLDRQQ
jgi:hypothetical protein